MLHIVIKTISYPGNEFDTKLGNVSVFAYRDEALIEVENNDNSEWEEPDANSEREETKDNRKREETKDNKRVRTDLVTYIIPWKPPDQLITDLVYILMTTVSYTNNKLDISDVFASNEKAQKGAEKIMNDDVGEWAKIDKNKWHKLNTTIHIIPSTIKNSYRLIKSARKIYHNKFIG